MGKIEKKELERFVLAFQHAQTAISKSHVTSWLFIKKHVITIKEDSTLSSPITHHQ